MPQETSDNNGFPRTFGGGDASLRIHYGASSAPSDAPLILGAEAGMSCLSVELEHWSSPLRLKVLRLADAMREAEDGMWLAFVDVPRERRLALVQSNRGFGESSFYRRHHGVAHDTGHSVWHDFYARAGYYLLDEIESRWQTPSVEISHPTGSGWLPDLAPALLDGIRHQLDDRDDGTHVLRDLFFRDGGGCELGDPQTLSRALDRIEAEPRTPWRPVTSERFGPEHFGLSSLSDSVALLRVDVGSKPT